MLDFLLRIPSAVVLLVWSLFFPARAPAIPAATPAASDPNAPSSGSQREGHELSDADPAVIVRWVIGLFVMIFTTIALVGWLYSHLYTRASAIPVQRRQTSFENAPRAKTSIAQDWATVSALAAQRLDGYGWTDRAHGLVHVPISRAMELVAKEGMPARNLPRPYFPPPEEEKLPLMQLESNSNVTKVNPH
jgi:hypothetical protein